MGLNGGATERLPQDQQIILLNRDAVEEAVGRGAGADGYG
jgi:hypothetical protein